MSEDLESESPYFNVLFLHFELFLKLFLIDFIVAVSQLSIRLAVPTLEGSGLQMSNTTVLDTKGNITLLQAA